MKTKKAAKQAGLLSADGWLKQDRIIKKKAIPLIIKSEGFFGHKQTEEINTKTAWGKKGRIVKKNAVSVKEKYFGIPLTCGHYSMFRKSDTKLRKFNKITINGR